jgi:hypothetical protein
MKLFLALFLILSACGPAKDVHDMNQKMDHMNQSLDETKGYIKNMLQIFDVMIKIIRNSLGLPKDEQDKLVLQIEELKLNFELSMDKQEK